MFHFYKKGTCEKCKTFPSFPPPPIFRESPCRRSRPRRGRNWAINLFPAPPSCSKSLAYPYLPAKVDKGKIQAGMGQPDFGQNLSEGRIFAYFRRSFRQKPLSHARKAKKRICRAVGRFLKSGGGPFLNRGRGEEKEFSNISLPNFFLFAYLLPRFLYSALTVLRSREGERKKNYDHRRRRRLWKFPNLSKKFLLLLRPETTVLQKKKVGGG